MTDMKYILYSLLVGMMMVSCSSADDIADDANSQQAAQQVDLLVSVGSKASQSNKQSVSALRRAATFLGMEDLVAIPFHTDGAAVEPTDHPYWLFPSIPMEQLLSLPTIPTSIWSAQQRRAVAWKYGH